MNAPPPLDNTEENARLLREGADAVVTLLRANWPNVPDDQMFMTLAIACGIFHANAVYPDVPENGATRCGFLFASGMMIGRARRTKNEIATCKGAA